MDWERRFDHMQQHTGQHLLSAVAQDRFAWETTAFHLGPDVSDVELAAPSLSSADLARLEEAVAAEIRAARPVVPRRVSLEEFRTLPVRTRGLPEGFTGDVRLVEIAGVDLNTCGGTHLANTAEIEAVALRPPRPPRRDARLLRGGRPRPAPAAPARGSERGAPRRARSVRRSPARRGEGEARPARRGGEAVRRAEESLAEAAAESLLSGGGRVTHAHWDGRDMGFVQSVARRFSRAGGGPRRAPDRDAEGRHVFALAAGEGFGDAQALGREIAALLGGKGGGSGRSSRGKPPLSTAWPARSSASRLREHHRNVTRAPSVRTR